MSKKNNKVKQTVKYVVSDWLCSLVAWVSFFFYRKIKEVPNFMEQYQTVFEDYNFLIGVITIPLFWLLLYTIVGYYHNVFLKSRLKELVQTFLVTLVGVVILFFAILGGLISGIIYASPFWLCGILCFVLKRNVGLWCAWAVYALVDTCLAYLLGFSRVVALRNFGLTVGSIFAWIMVLTLVVLIAVTVIRFGKKPFPEGKKGRFFLFVPWVLWFGLHGFSFLLGSTLTEWYNAEYIPPVYAYRMFSMLLSWGRIISLTVGLTMIVRYVRTKKRSRT